MKKRFSRLLTLILSVVMIASTVPVNAYAEEMQQSYEEGEFNTTEVENANLGEQDVMAEDSLTVEAEELVLPATLEEETFSSTENNENEDIADAEDAEDAELLAAGAPIGSVAFEIPEGGFVFNPLIEGSLDEFIAGIKVIATLTNDTTEDITDYCVFDVNNVNTEIPGVYQFKAFISRKDLNGDWYRNTLVGYLTVVGASNNVTVSYLQGDADYGKVPEADSVLYNEISPESITISGNQGKLSKKGYDFEYWADVNADLGNLTEDDIYRPGDEVNESLVLVPVFKAKGYRVNCSLYSEDSAIEYEVKPETGEFDIGSENVITYGSNGKIIVKVPENADNFYCIPNLDDVVFEQGTPTVEDGKNVYVITFTMPAHNIDIKILAKVTVTLDSNIEGGTFEAGEVVSTKDVIVPEKADKALCVEAFTVPTAPEGYEFIGWFEDEPCEIPLGVVNTFKNNQHIYAGWAFKAADGTMLVKAIPDQVYTGEKITPAICVTDGDKVLVQGVDYTVTYINNIDVNKTRQIISNNNLTITGDSVGSANVNKSLPYVIIKGKGNFSGEACMNFNIFPAFMCGMHKDADEHFDTFNNMFNAVYTSSLVVNERKKQKTDTLLTYFPKDKVFTLKENKDYQVFYYAEADTEYSNPMDGIPAGGRGSYKIEFRGMGNYSGSIFKDICVDNSDNYLARATVTVKSAKLTKTWNETTSTWENDVIVDIKSVKIGKNEIYEYKYEIIGAAPSCPGTYGLRILPRDGSELTGYKDIKVKVAAADNKGLSPQYADNHVFVGHNDTDLFEGIWDTKLVNNDGPYKLQEGVDYTCSFKAKGNIFDAGTVNLSIVGKGIYTGYKKTVAIKIAPYDIAQDSRDLIRVEVPNTVSLFNPKGAVHSVNVWYGNNLLVAGRDYTVSYANNKAIVSKKAPTITVKGIGNFKGTLKDVGTFKIIAKPFSEANVSIATSDVIGTANKAIAVKFTLTDIESGTKLAANKDYDGKNLIYNVNDGADMTKAPVFGVDCNVGDIIEVTVKAKGNYRGIVTFKTVVRGKAFKSVKLFNKIADKTFTGNEIALDSSEVVLTYKLSSDAEAAYFNATGRKTVDSKKNISDEYITTLKKGDTILLRDGYDYSFAECDYSNNVKVGTAKITVYGKGFFADSMTANYKIKVKKFKWFGN